MHDVRPAKWQRRMTTTEALERLERIAKIVDDLAYAVGCGLEGTRTAKNIREAVATLRRATENQATTKSDVVERARAEHDAMEDLLRYTGPFVPEAQGEHHRTDHTETLGRLLAYVWGPDFMQDGILVTDMATFAGRVRDILAEAK